MNLGFATESTAGTAEFDPFDEFRRGVELLKNEYPQKALVRLRRAFESDKHNAYYSSFLGLAIARAQRKWDQASELCEIAVQLKPKEIQFHLNLGEVYALAGRREKALDKLDQALEIFGEDARLKQARSKVENRRALLLPFFGRKHFLNRNLGKLRHRIFGSLSQ
ncbi:MAG TPA: tetratricopeptide repeat protein [Candidatus Acidoferrum sp.]